MRFRRPASPDGALSKLTHQRGPQGPQSRPCRTPSPSPLIFFGKVTRSAIGEEYTHDQPSCAGDQLRRRRPAAKMIQDALGYIGEWLKTEARYLA